MQTEVEKENTVRVEEIIGNVTPIQNTEEQQNTANTQNIDVIQNEATDTQVQVEVEPYLAQGYYVVQAGDSLAEICRKVYHTTAMLESLCEANDIENPDAIFAGQRLVLPN